MHTDRQYQNTNSIIKWFCTNFINLNRFVKIKPQHIYKWNVNSQKSKVKSQMTFHGKDLREHSFILADVICDSCWFLKICSRSQLHWKLIKLYRTLHRMYCVLIFIIFFRFIFSFSKQLICKSKSQKTYQ